MSKHKFFFIALAVLVLCLAGFIYLQERVVQQGDEVILATRPVDPRDLFRGEYVILRYAIETDERIQAVISEHPDTSEVYVRLAPGAAEGVAEVVAARANRPDFATGIWLQGEVQGTMVRFPDLEQYFLPEGSGRPIERLRSDLHVRVRVLKGDARVVGLLDENLDTINVYDYRE